MIVLFGVALLLGAIVGAVADSKGHHFVPWMIFGVLLFPLALPMVMLLTPSKAEIERKALEDNAVKCPFCAETIRREAIVCRYCGRDLPNKTGS